jgi:hypothetical protein
MKPSDLTGFRVEFRFEGNLSIAQSHQYFQNYLQSHLFSPCIHCVRNITPPLYLALLKECIAFVRDEGLFRGRDSTRVSTTKLTNYSVVCRDVANNKESDKQKGIMVKQKLRF